VAFPIVMPSLGMYTAEGTLVAWLRAPGTLVRAGEPIAEISTEKATHELVAPNDGILHQLAVIGTDLQVETLIGYILVEGESVPSRGQPASTVASKAPAGETLGAAGRHTAVAGELRVTPVARRLALKHGIELALIRGTGPGGRIVEADIIAAISSSEPRPSLAQPLRVRQRMPLSPMRRTIAERLKKGAADAVSVTLIREVRADGMVGVRTRLGEEIGGPVSFDALFIKLLALALREHPELNAAIENETLVYYEDVHIGFAVAISDGVIVPVVRHADSETLQSIQSSVADMTQRALDGSLRAGDIEGGTATLTNLGGYGIDGFTPVLNPPQAVILGIGRVMERPWVDRGVLVPAQTCVLSLTFDHRVADGVPAAQLLDSIAKAMNNAEGLFSLAAV
jgi:pyruvate dehydrogenase E2 component (dihydrolipoyllysine-residue acetyltransferase)